MKANAPKRKIFNDAVDMLTDAPVAAGSNDIQMLPVEQIKPFRDHPFRLYEGERLSDMVESIKEHGILVPVIVRQTDDGYEMLAGHNRQNAASLAGISEIPAIVKKDITDADAYVYVIETNMIQRSFSELSTSEKAAVLAARYEKVSSQGRRNDILQEIAALNGTDVTSGHSDQKLTGRDSVGKEYELSGSSVARLLRVNQLIPEFKDQLDAGELPFMVGVGLSHLSDEEQGMVKDAAQGQKIKLVTVSELRKEAGTLTRERVGELMGNKPVRESKAVSVKLPAAVYQKYFSGVKASEAVSIMEQALELYFRERGNADVPGEGTAVAG